MTTLATPTTTHGRLALPPLSVAEPVGGGGPSFRDFVAIIRQRIVLIVVLSILFSGVAIGIWLLMWFKFPTYSSEALILCVSENPQEGPTMGDRQPPKDAFERFVESQARILKSPDILDLALQTPEVKATTWFKEIGNTEKARLVLEEELHSGFVRGTNFVQVRMGCRDIKDPRVIVDQVVRQYIPKVMDEAVSQYEDDLRGAKRERDRLEQSIGDRRDKIRDHASNFLNPGTLLEGPGPLREQLNFYGEQVAAIQAQLDEITPLFELYSNPRRPVDFGEEMAAVESDPQVAALASQRLQIEQLMKTSESVRGTNHREYKNLKAQLDAVEHSLAQVREERLNKLITIKREQVETAYRNLQQQLLRAENQYNMTSAQQRDQDRQLSVYNAMVDELKWQEDRYQKVEEQVFYLQRVVTDKSAVRVQVAQRPVDPLERSSPSILMLPAGVFVAILAAVGIVVLMSLMDTSVRTPLDVLRYLNLPLLGAIPDLDDEEVPIERVETAVRDVPRSMIVEAFRTVRTNLQFSAPADRQRTVMITSPQPLDGKTTVACNLAASMALAGRRVLLVDANLRRPAIHNFHDGVTSEVGLSNVLVSEATLAAVVKTTSLANLDVVPAGPLPPNPAELLGSRQMRTFLDEATAIYDQIFLDLPPVLLANDALVLSTLVDGVILVCRAKQNSRGVAQRAIRQLAKVNAHMFGAVLNAVQVQRGGYFREQLRTFYDYSEYLPGGDGSPKLPSPSK